MLRETLEERARKFCQDEYRDYLVYKMLSAKESDEEKQKLLEKLAHDELRHYRFWSKLLGRRCTAALGRLEAALIVLSRRLFGLSFTLKLLERGEEETIKAYKEALEEIPDELKGELERIIEDEVEHEDKLLSSFEEARTKYIGFVALGLADAIVEITGVHAGFLGYSTTTLMAGIAGLVVGFSATLSMASAAYIQAKEVEGRDPLVSALVTGLAYIAAVLVLAVPYFLTDNMKLAFAASIAAGLAVVGVFTFYSTTISGRSFLRDYLETAGLMVGTAFAAYFFGAFLRDLFGVPLELG